MFDNKKTVFIGKFDGYNHGQLKRVFKKNGGSCVGNVSRNIDFIIVPINPRDSIKENQQIKRAQQQEIPILKISYIIDSINNGRMLSYSGYKLMDLNNVMVTPFQNNENITKRYQIYVHPSGKKYHYDIQTGHTNWGVPNNPDEKIIFIKTDERLQREIEKLYFGKQTQSNNYKNYEEDPMQFNTCNIKSY